MSKKWGAPTWIFLHTFAEKIDDAFYQANVGLVLNVIGKVLTNLPCPYCRSHALSYFKHIKPKNVPDRQTLIRMLFHFHNTVNRRTRSRQFKESDLRMYMFRRMDFVTTAFIKAFSHRYKRVLMGGHLPENGRRKRVAFEILAWLRGCWRMFQR